MQLTKEEDFSCPDLEKVSVLYGLGYSKVERIEQVSNLKSLITKNGPCIIDVKVSNLAKLATKVDNDILNRESIKCDNRVCV